MKNIPAVLIKEKNKLFTPSPWLVLLDIVLDSAHTLHFVGNNEDVAFGGRVYTAFPFILEPTKESTKGDIPTVTLKICNVTQIVQGYLEDLDGAAGAEATVRVVNAARLDQDHSELEMTFSVLGTEADAEWITFKLGAVNPLRRRYPPFRHIATHCNWIFKGAECGYSGIETACNRTFADCEARSNTVRFGGCLGLSQKGWRAV